MHKLLARAGLASALFVCPGVAPAQNTALPRTPVTAGPSAGGVVNAPVAPDAVYYAVGGTLAGIGVIDMNGYGQGTGSPSSTNFPNNPNVGAPGVTPPLAPGTTSLDAGGAGPATLTEDSIGRTVLTEPGLFGRVVDLQIGQPLDLLLNNENRNPFATGASQINPATGTAMAGNTISVAPHPNPPRIVMPPPNPTRGIVSEEPTATTSVAVAGRVTTTSPPCVPSPINLLGIGDPLAGMPGLFGAMFDGVFYGPQPPPPSPPPPIPFCPFTSRQQVGHFLYALDADRDRVVALHSNRFIELARIPVADAVAIAIAPNLRWLAVATDGPGTIAFVDVDPRSPTFHQVVHRTFVGHGRKTLAWQPEGEDLMVANRDLGQLTLISGATLQPRKVLTSRFLTAPIDVVATARQTRLGFNTGTWFGYVLNADGTVAIFESGPDAIGYDDVIGQLRDTFAAATTMQPDVTDFGRAFYVAHRDTAGRGTVSRVELAQSARDPLPVASGSLPNKRGRLWSIAWRTASPLSGDAVVDLAFDDTTNRGAWPDARSSVVPGLSYAEHSGKGHVKIVDGAPTAAHAPRFLFIVTSDAGKIDLVDLTTGRVVRTLDAPGVTSLAGYWRQ